MYEQLSQQKDGFFKEGKFEAAFFHFKWLKDRVTQLCDKLNEWMNSYRNYKMVYLEKERLKSHFGILNDWRMVMRSFMTR